MSRFDSEPYSYGNHLDRECENCGRRGLRLTVTPTLYRACDDCMDECLAAIAQKAKEVEEGQRAVALVQMMQAAGCTPAEIGAWARMTPQRAVAELKQREVA